MQITDDHLDAIKEMVNIGVGKAAGILNQMTDSHIQLSIPECKVFHPSELLQQSAFAEDEKISAVCLTFESPFSGTSALMFSSESAFNLVSILVDENDYSFDMDSLRIGTLQEVGNIVLNAVIGSLGNVLGENIEYTPPDYYEDSLKNLIAEYDENENMILFIRAHFGVENQLIEGDIIIIFRLSTFDNLLSSIESLMYDND